MKGKPVIAYQKYVFTYIFMTGYTVLRFNEAYNWLFMKCLLI